MTLSTVASGRISHNFLTADSTSSWLVVDTCCVFPVFLIISHIFYVKWTRFSWLTPGLLSICTENEKVCSVDASVSLSLFATLLALGKLNTTFTSFHVPGNADDGRFFGLFCAFFFGGRGTPSVGVAGLGGSVQALLPCKLASVACKDLTLWPDTR